MRFFKIPQKNIVEKKVELNIFKSIGMTSEELIQTIRNLREKLNKGEIDIYKFYEEICYLID